MENHKKMQMEKMGGRVHTLWQIKNKPNHLSSW